MFCFCFSGSKFLINLRRQFHVHKFFIHKFLRDLQSSDLFYLNLLFRKERPFVNLGIRTSALELELEMELEFELILEMPLFPVP